MYFLAKNTEFAKSEISEAHIVFNKSNFCARYARC